MELEGLQDKCGVFACVAADPWPSDLEIANIITIALVGLQHRGQESAGIVTSSGESPLFYHRGMGLVNQVFDIDTLKKLEGNLGIGHTRYSTMGASDRLNCQPFVVESTYGQFAVAHNGELINGVSLKKRILQKGIGLSTGSDSEVITQLLCETPECGEPFGVNWSSRIHKLMSETQLSYSLVIMSEDKVFAVRDPYGNRPLCLGYLTKQNRMSSASLNGELLDNPRHVGFVVSSESCVFNSIGGHYFREVLPGEIVQIDRNGFKSMGIIKRQQGLPALCIFEYIYFSRPDSYLEGQQVNAVRFRCGEQLAKECTIDADIVSGVPESATAAALGFAKQSGIDYVEVLTRNRYVGRTFIQPSTHLRQIGVAKKFGFLRDNFQNKRVILVDDSIVRGNTIAPLVYALKKFGATEVHLRIASPPIKHPCYMGINIPTENELIFNQVGSVENLAKEVGANSLQYLSVDGLHKAVNAGIKNHTTDNIGHCNACLTGKYPNINNLLMFMRLYNKTVGAASLHTSLSGPSRFKVFVKNDKKLGKPKVLVWKGMTIKEFVKALDRSGNDVMDAIDRVMSSSQKLTYSTEIHDMYVLSAVAKLCGRSVRERVVEKDVIIVDKDVYNRNIYLNPERLKPRPPVVTIMGHVDHGKTTLIDSLRSSRIVDSEFGGITQHLGAFKVKLSDISGKGNINSSNDIVTFLDTPGHAAFSSMRCRGAHCTDIVILVVSVDDGIMPQTLESIRFAKEAKVPIIVVMNKVDRLFNTIAEVNTPATKRTFDPIRHSLSKHGVVVEELGGDVQCLPISALKIWNLDLLQESVLALSEIINIRCDYEGACEGVVLEARNAEHFGKVATVLVQQGTVKLGTILVAGHSFAKVRTMRSDAGKSINEALPGDPIEVTGWRETLPCAGDGVIEVETESRAKEVLHYRKTLIDQEKSERDYKAYTATMEAYKASYKEYINEGFKKGFRLWQERPELSNFLRSTNIVNGVEVPQINLVIKTDVQGSLEAIEDVLAVATASCADQCVLKLARIGVGNMTENDMELAAGCNAIVYLFNLPGSLLVTRSLAIDVRHFNVIYHLFDDLKDEILVKLPATNQLEVIGEAEVLQMFDIREKNVKVSVVGCKCISGMLVKSKDQYCYRVMRNRLSDVTNSGNHNTMEVIKDELTCKSLRHLRNDVESIRRGVECGIVLVDQSGETFPIKESDVLQCCKRIISKPKLKWNLGFQ